ncbi:Alpha/Beta hydrolase protein [Lentinula aciculospora]|uniref:Alpha/Beta hydrolase protein n=1 Tax=Lentinula aciculospora TaxID=153920 RepID=A0A9W9AJ93_9AGAR|nr:Alpha/Beta hydrolase protein [Lentinula aciculospora]
MPFVKVKTSSGKIKFHYIISTPNTDSTDKINPDLPVVLCFHSLAFPHVFHSQFADPLLRKFNLVVFDFRTHGDTEGDDLLEGYGVQEAAVDALAFMDALRLPPCHFLAIDYGSPIALQIAVTHPDKVLSLFIMSHTCLKEPPDVCEGHRQVYDAWNSAFPAPDQFDLERGMEGGYGFSQFMFSNKMTNLAQALFNVTFPLCQKHWGYYGRKNYRIATLDFLCSRQSQSKAALSRLRCPVKLVYGTDDVAYTQDFSEEFLQNLEDAGVDASLYVIPGAPHFCGVDYANIINPVIHDFIVQNDDRTPPPVSSNVLSPWDELLRKNGWAPEGSNDSDDDDFVISYVSCRAEGKATVLMFVFQIFSLHDSIFRRS